MGSDSSVVVMKFTGAVGTISKHKIIVSKNYMSNNLPPGNVWNVKASEGALLPDESKVVTVKV